MKTLRVTRTIVIEGPEEWVAETLGRGLLTPSRQVYQLTDDKSIMETHRVTREVFPDPNTD